MTTPQATAKLVKAARMEELVRALWRKKARELKRWPAGSFDQVDVDKWLAMGLLERGGSVTVDGVDVTDRCRYFDQSAGVAECYVYGRDGRIRQGDGGPEVERVYGRVEVWTPL